jgi:hypothetical protein
LPRCLFSYSDGRQCCTPRQSGHPHFCFFHARKEAQARAADEAGREVSGFLSGSYLSACDLSSALARLFAATAQGQIKPRTAATLAYLGQTLVQSIQIAEHEYINAFSTNGWRRAVRSSFQGDSEEDNEQAHEPSQESTPKSALDSPQSFAESVLEEASIR